MATTLEKTFWEQYQRFLHVTLLTETQHPQSTHLSEWAQQDLPRALTCLQTIDLEALEQLKAFKTEQHTLTHVIQKTLAAGNRVFILGCGASGRMAVNLEWLWRKAFPDKAHQVVGVIAGGDAALIRSIEQFEDNAEYGTQQLIQQGFTQNDLLIATTASGESRFILKALTDAAISCKAKPWLLVCNPLEQLIQRNPTHPCQRTDIDTWAMVTGPMALTGSTRMQATTAMMLGIGLALFHPKDHSKILTDFIATYRTLDLSFLKQGIEQESIAYQQKKPTHYELDAECGMTVLTDITERAPTFNCPPLNNTQLPQEPQSLVSVSVQGAKNAENAWEILLGRNPFCLSWEKHPQTFLEYLLGFEISSVIPAKAGIQKKFNLDSRLRGNDTFLKQTLLKLLLNTHSTLVMGRAGHYEGNIMTWVVPSNAKLIDRAIRTIQMIRQKMVKTADYQKIAKEVFETLPQLKSNESIIKRLA